MDDCTFVDQMDSLSEPLEPTVENYVRVWTERISAMPSIHDIVIPHIPITSGELASFLLFAPNAVIREMADEAKRTGVAPFGRLHDGR